MLSRFCAAWIILLALAPFTAPFAVCHPGQILGASQNAPRPTSRRDDFETWVMEGVALSVEPTPPLATTIAAMATTTAVGIDTATNLEPPAAVQPAPLRLRGATILVLRV